MTTSVDLCLQMEIDLLKNLNHANIVKYNGFVKSAESLYIILEYAVLYSVLLDPAYSA